MPYNLVPHLTQRSKYIYIGRRATHDPYWRHAARQIIFSIQNITKVVKCEILRSYGETDSTQSCGYAGVADVNVHRLEDQMNSFFLAGCSQVNVLAPLCLTWLSRDIEVPLSHIR